MIKLVLSDMDNTIVPLGAGRVTEHLRAAVHACLDAGVRFAPATGRDPDGLERFFCGDEACYASMLASNSKVIALTVAHAISAERQQEVRALVEGACPGLVCRAPALGVFDVMPCGWDKASGMQVLMDEMGITVDEVCVFGDSENDLPLLNACPNSVAVANAMPEAAAAARYHIGACADDAVADALFDIAEAAKTGEMPAFMR